MTSLQCVHPPTSPPAGDEPLSCLWHYYPTVSHNEVVQREGQREDQRENKDGKKIRGE